MRMILLTSNKIKRRGSGGTLGSPKLTSVMSLKNRGISPGSSSAYTLSIRGLTRVSCWTTGPKSGPKLCRQRGHCAAKHLDRQLVCMTCPHSSCVTRPRSMLSRHIEQVSWRIAERKWMPHSTLSLKLCLGSRGQNAHWLGKAILRARMTAFTSHDVLWLLL